MPHLEPAAAERRLGNTAFKIGRAISRMAKAPARFLRSERGAVSTFAAMFILPLIGLVGIGADAGKIYLAQARLSAAVDAAALAGGKDANSPDFSALVLKYFHTNFNAAEMGATLTGPSFSYNSLTDKVKVSAAAAIPTAFMHLFGFDSMMVYADAEVTRKSIHMDVVLSIDMSGSMGGWVGGTQKIAAARDAATTLVNILYGGAETKDLLKIGLVPWNGNVNVMNDGKTYDPSTVTKKFLTNSFKNPVTGLMQDHVWTVTGTAIRFMNQPDATWKGCVYARYIEDSLTANDADAKDGSLNHAPTGKWLTNGFEARNEGGLPSGATPCLPHGITKLNQSKTSMLSAISALQNPTGYTNIAQGLMWAWRVLSHDINPYKQGTADTPEKPVIRAIVLLSDGSNCSATSDGYKGVWGTSCGSTANGKMDDRLKAVAAAAKAKGIHIYVIQFGTNSSSLATLLKTVASGTGAPYYHYAPDASALQTVFKEIANALSELRLSQ